MHELSIALALVETATNAADRASESGAIAAVSVRIGSLSSVVPEALASAWTVAAEGTRCARAELCIERVAGRVWCRSCGIETELSDPPRFRCGRCGSPAGDVRAGWELELVSLEVDSNVDEAEEGHHAAAHP